MTKKGNGDKKRGTVRSVSTSPTGGCRGPSCVCHRSPAPPGPPPSPVPHRQAPSRAVPGPSLPSAVGKQPGKTALAAICGCCRTAASPLRLTAGRYAAHRALPGRSRLKSSSACPGSGRPARLRASPRSGAGQPRGRSPSPSPRTPCRAPTSNASPRSRPRSPCMGRRRPPVPLRCRMPAASDSGVTSAPAPPQRDLRSARGRHRRGPFRRRQEEAGRGGRYAGRAAPLRAQPQPPEGPPWRWSRRRPRAPPPRRPPGRPRGRGGGAALRPGGGRRVTCLFCTASPPRRAPARRRLAERRSPRPSPVRPRRRKARGSPARAAARRPRGRARGRRRSTTRRRRP